MLELTITIFEATDEVGFFYDIYEKVPNDEGDMGGSIDGGFCTTTMENALEMAYTQAIKIIKERRENETDTVKLGND